MLAREIHLRRLGLAGVALCAALLSPRGMADAPDTAAAPAPLQLSSELGSAEIPSSTSFQLAQPVPGAPISSPFGWRMHPILKVMRFHNGVDYAAPLGTPVHAAAGGTVEAIGRRKDFGLFLRIRHPGELETGYSHLSSLAPGIAVGQTIEVGEVIGKIGRSGMATGPHLDFEVVVAGRNVDPVSCAGSQPAPSLHLLVAERIDAPAALIAVADSNNPDAERHAADYQGVLEAQGAGPWRRMMQQ